MWLHETHTNILGRTGEKTIVLSKSDDISVNKYSRCFIKACIVKMKHLAQFPHLGAVLYNQNRGTSDLKNSSEIADPA